LIFLGVLKIWNSGFEYLRIDSKLYETHLT